MKNCILHEIPTRGIRYVLLCPSIWAHDMKLLRDIIWDVNGNLALK
jgi:hypothetical protein